MIPNGWRVDKVHPHGAVAYKYADPTEDARYVFDAAEAREIEREDPSLIVWLTTDESTTDDSRRLEGR